MALRTMKILVIITHIILIVNAKFQCLDVTNCGCSSGKNGFELYCPSFDDVKIKIDFNPNRKTLGLYCQAPYDISGMYELKELQEEFDLKILPNLNESLMNAIEMQHCNLINNIAQVLKNLGVNNTKNLTIDNNNLTSSVLEKHDLDGFNALIRLHLQKNAIDAIEVDFFNDMKELILLDLSDNSMHLKSEQFMNLNNLKHLDLSRNQMLALPKNVFKGLKKLDVLDMWANSINELPLNLFDDLNELRYLELSINQISQLNEDDFNGLINLLEINIGQNNLSEIPANLFKNNKLLQLIRIENNLLKTLPNKLFSNFVNLKQVKMSNCGLNQVTSDLFSNSVNLQIINMADNKISALPQGIFDGLINLQKLNLDGNKINALGGDVFKNLQRLDYLNLSYNKIARISKDLFENLSNLRELYMQRNRITDVDNMAFYYNEKLAIVNLAWNNITFDEFQDIEPFNQNTKLEKLNLSHNLINRPFLGLLLLCLNLSLVDYEYNLITRIDYDDFQSSSNKPLRINMKNNQITEINLDQAELKARANPEQELDANSHTGYSVIVELANNPINCDCTVYELLRYYNGTMDPRVRTLIDFKSNNLTCASPPNFIGINVENIAPHMVTCAVEMCPKNCTCVRKPASKSYIVDCVKMNLTAVPIIPWHGDPRMNNTEVYLQDNFIINAPHNNMGYDNVTKLFLSNNLINAIDWAPPKIQELRLDNNNIDFLKYEVLSGLNHSSVYLHNNPWRCDCEVSNLSHFLRDHVITFKSDIRCNRNETIVKDLIYEEYCPNTLKTVAISSTIVSIAILLIISLMAVCYYKYKQQIKIWLYAHNSCLWCVMEEDLDKDKLFDAFISYSHKDEDFIVNELVPKLENGAHPYKLCLHTRNWIAGEFITKQITDSVKDSRRTIVVLSEHFLESVWGKMEFRTAHTQAMSEGRARVIVILYGDIDPNSPLMDDELKAYLKTNTYIKWGEDSFWNKLRYSLPHSQQKVAQNQKLENMMVNIDKMVLVNGCLTPNVGTTPPAIDPLLLKDKRNPLEFKIDMDALTPPAEYGHDNLIMTNTEAM